MKNRTNQGFTLVEFVITMVIMLSVMVVTVFIISEPLKLLGGTEQQVQQARGMDVALNFIGQNVKEKMIKGASIDIPNQKTLISKHKNQYSGFVFDEQYQALFYVKEAQNGDIDALPLKQKAVVAKNVQACDFDLLPAKDNHQVLKIKLQTGSAQTPSSVVKFVYL